MSIFGNIMSAIFGREGTPKSAGPAASDPSAPKPASSAQTGPPSAGASSSPSSQPVVDVEAVLNNLAAQKKEKLDWRKSIVDLMKLLDLDSSFAARKQLAQELHYTGDTKDSASMNVWLHKQVMKKLADNGGKVPAELRH